MTDLIDTAIALLGEAKEKLSEVETELKSRIENFLSEALEKLNETDETDE